MVLLRVFEAFAGYGGSSFALKKANIPFELIGFSEIDKYAIKCFEQNHDCRNNFGNISRIDWKIVPDFDLLLGGFPCQDISLAGKRDLSKNRSNLGFELTRALIEKQPKFFLFENVKNILSEHFDFFRKSLIDSWKKAGYVVAYSCLNSSDFGVPQNRERVWFVGFRKDVFEFGKFVFPKPIELKLKLKDLLEKEVDEKYFLKEETIKRLLNGIEKSREKGSTFGEVLLPQKEIYGTLLARDYKEPKCIELTNKESQGSRVYSVDGLSCCLNSIGGGLGAKTGLYLIDRHTKSIQENVEINSSLKSEQGSGNKFLIGNVFGEQLEVANCLSTSHSKIGNQEAKNLINVKNRIRKLTPKECFRLMGFFDDEIDLSGLNDTQCYKLAGNGWCLRPVVDIFKQMFRGEVN